MPLYVLERTQLLATTLDAAWAFFTDPYNLARITPPWLGLEVTNAPEVPIRPGTLITYRVRPVARLALRWTSEITHLEASRLFVDEQRFGPYRFWHHLHRFEAVAGGIRMTDRVHYRLYGGALAAPLHRAVVRPRLEAIFAYRREALRGLFPGPAWQERPPRL